MTGIPPPPQQITILFASTRLLIASCSTISTGWGSNDTAVSATGIFFHNITICFFCMFSLFSGHEMSNWFAWILEGRIIFIDTYLCNNSYDRCAHKSAFAKAFTKRILQVVSDVCRLMATQTERGVFGWFASSLERAAMALLIIPTCGPFP